MKFKLFGDDDCPDVVLAQLSTLSQFSDAQIDALVEHVLEALLVAPPTNGSHVDLVASSATRSPVEDLFENTDLFTTVRGSDLCQACCAAGQLFVNALRFGVPAAKVAEEVSVLGLPRHVGVALSTALFDHGGALRSKLWRDVVRLPGVSAVAPPTSELWRDETSGQHFVHLQLTTSTPAPGEPPLLVALTAEKAQALLAELVAARRSLESLA